jgi:hypothetical protein
MKYVLIDAKAGTVQLVKCQGLDEAKILADLEPNQVDHGVIFPGVGIVVAEFGLFEPKEKQVYFALEGRLYAGNAVLYGYETGSGVDKDMTHMPPALFFKDYEAVETAIKEGFVSRPEIAINGEVIWRWPEPRK